MIQLQRHIVLGLVGTLFFFGATTAQVAAHGDKARKDQKDLAMAQQAQTGLRDAISAAEQKTGGRAISAELEGRWDGLRYEVKLVQGTTVQKVEIDARTGAVLEVRPAHRD
jgi:uncharacterized membrane protein YkoI